MGKREVGELSIVDLAIFVLMGEIAAIALDDYDRQFFKAVLPIILLFLIQYLNSWLILKNKKLRDFIEGDPSLVIRDGFICEMEMKKQRYNHPSLVIRDGFICEMEMKKQRYNLDDLLQQLRE